MGDLQRPIDNKGIRLAPVFKMSLQNSDANSPADCNSSLKFSAPDSGENFIRSDLRRFGTGSIDVLLEPALFLEFPDKADGLIGGARAELRDDINERALDILGHPLGVAADIDVRAVGQPRPQLAADFAHAVLHIEFLVA